MKENLKVQYIRDGPTRHSNDVVPWTVEIDISDVKTNLVATNVIQITQTEIYYINYLSP